MKKTASMIIFLLLILFSLILIAPGCSCGDDDDDDDDSSGDDDDDTSGDDDDDTSGDDDDDDDDHTVSDCTGTELVCEDFESYNVGDVPGGPFVASFNGTANISVVEDDIEYGKVMELSDPETMNTSASFVWDHNTTFTSGIFTLEFDAMLIDGFVAVIIDRPDTFSESVIYFRSSGPSLYAADNNQVEHECGPMPAGSWSQIQVELDLDGCTYSVFVDGNPGNCLDLSCFVSATPPTEVGGVEIYTGTEAGAGRFDNIRIMP